MQIRDMTPEDCLEVCGLYSRCFSNPWSKKSVEETFHSKGYTSLVAEEKGRIAGYIGMLAVLNEADIINVAVDPSMQRNGIGKTLLRHLKERAGQQQITRIFLEVRASNEAAIALYENAGFIKIDVRKQYYDKPKEDALIMLWENR